MACQTFCGFLLAWFVVIDRSVNVKTASDNFLSRADIAFSLIVTSLENCSKITSFGIPADIYSNVCLKIHVTLL